MSDRSALQMFRREDPKGCTQWAVRPLLSLVALPKGQVNPKLAPYCSMLLVAPDHIEGGTGRMLSLTSAAEQGAISGKYQFSRGCILYSKIRPYLRKAAIANFDGLCSADMYPLMPLASQADSDFILQILLGQHFTAFAESVSSRSGIPKINREELGEYSFLAPPLAEQRAIATALSDTDALIVAQEKLIAKKRDIKTATMQRLLTGRKRLPGFGEGKAWKQSELGSLPEDWALRPFLTVLTLQSGLVDPRQEPFSSMVLVAPDHIESDTGRLLHRATARQQRAISGKYLFSPGTLVYSKIRPYLKKLTLVDFEGLCSADMYPLAPKQDVCIGFIREVMLAQRFSHYAEAVSARSGIPKLNREELAEFVFALPPLAEQKAIAEVLSDMDAEIAALEARLGKQRDIKQGMMQELLTGRTRLV